MKRLLTGLAIVAGLAICGINAQAQTAVYKTFTLTDTVTTYAYTGLAGQSTCTVSLGAAAALGGGTVLFLTSGDGGASYQAVTGFTDLGLPGNNPQNSTASAGTKYTVPVAGQTAIEVVLANSSGANVPGSLNCNGGVARANAGPPLVRYGPVAVTSPTSLPDLTLTGQSTCSMTLTGTATVTPQGSSDGGASYSTPAPGETTTTGTTAIPAAPAALTNFHVDVSGITGTAQVSEACSAASSTTSLAGVATCPVVSTDTCSTNGLPTAPAICLATFDGADTTTTQPPLSIIYTAGSFFMRLLSSDTGTIAVYYFCP